MYLANRHSKEKINPQTRVEQLQVKQLRYDNTTTVLHGARAVKRNSTTGQAELAADTDPFVYLNWMDSNVMCVTDTQGAATLPPYNIPTQPLTAGGLTVFEGYGEEYDMDINEFHDTTTAIQGNYITVVAGGTGKLHGIAAGGMGAKIHFGMITRVEGSRVFFTFRSQGLIY